MLLLGALSDRHSSIWWYGCSCDHRAGGSSPPPPGKVKEIGSSLSLVGRRSYEQIACRAVYLTCSCSCPREPGPGARAFRSCITWWCGRLASPPPVYKMWAIALAWFRIGPVVCYTCCISTVFHFSDRRRSLPIAWEAQLSTAATALFAHVPGWVSCALASKVGRLDLVAWLRQSAVAYTSRSSCGRSLRLHLPPQRAAADIRGPRLQLPWQCFLHGRPIVLVLVALRARILQLACRCY